MTFVEGIHSYQNSTASNTQSLNSVKETIRPLSSYTQELTPGKVFEGMVTEVKNGQVTLGLSDGQTITARLDSGVTLEKGQPMLFEVKANNGEQIAIRPVTLESAQNPTLLRALEAAGLKVNERNLSMVNNMMKEQLPIDKNSLLQMARVAGRFPGADMQTLVQMQKLGMNINEASLNQFQNYKNGQQSFLPELQTLMEEVSNLPEKLFGNSEETVLQQGNEAATNIMLNGNSQAAGNGAGTLLGLQQQFVGILMGGQAAAGAGQEAQSAAVQNAAGLQQLEQNQTMQNTSVSQIDAAEGVIIHQDATEGSGLAENGFTGETLSGNGLTGEHPAGKGLTGEALSGESLSGNGAAVEGKAVGAAAGKEMAASAATAEQQTAAPIDNILTKEQQQNLTDLLKGFSGVNKEGNLLSNGQLNNNLSAGELLQQMVSAVENSENFTSASMQKLFYSDEYKAVLKQAMEDQWTLTPEQLKEEGAVKELYQKLGKQMEQLQQLAAQSGKEAGNMAKTAQAVQSNLEFMNQVNQMYTYVQLPLKLYNQNAHSDLYVYTNKKNLQEKNGELTALLHLDMEQLGATDIYVKMVGTSVETDFYLSEEASYQLIAKHTDQLAQRLERKGYQCEIRVENRKKQQDFVQDFLEQEKPVGKLHRYSFDVKA